MADLRNCVWCCVFQCALSCIWCWIHRWMSGVWGRSNAWLPVSQRLSVYVKTACLYASQSLQEPSLGILTVIMVPVPDFVNYLSTSRSWLHGYKIQEAQLSPRDRAMRRVIEILPIATQQWRNYLYDKSWPNRWYEVGDNVHSTMTRSSGLPLSQVS